MCLHGCQKQVRYPPNFVSCTEEIKSLESPDSEIRLIASHRIEGCPGNIVVDPALERLPKEDDDAVAYRLAHTISLFPGTSAHLERLLQSKERWLRYYSTLAINPADWKKFIRLLHDADPDIRLSYAQKLWGNQPHILKKAAESETDLRVKTWFLKYSRKQKPFKRVRRSMAQILATEKETYK